MMISIIYTIFLQINLEGFEEAAQQSTLFAILVSIVLVLFGIVIFLYRKLDEKHDDVIKIQEDYLKRIDEIRKENNVKEDDRIKQWKESEKEVLKVLNGVNSVLDMSEVVKENDTEKILNKLSVIESKIEGK